MLEDFKADDGEEKRNKVEAELVAAKDAKKKLDERMVDVECRATEVAKTNSTS